jgi:hypothetical protein
MAILTNKKNEIEETYYFPNATTLSHGRLFNPFFQS